MRGMCEVGLVEGAKPQLLLVCLRIASFAGREAVGWFC